MHKPKVDWAPNQRRLRLGLGRERRKKKTGKRVKRINLIAIHVFEIEAKRLYRNKWKIGFFFPLQKNECVCREGK